MKPLIVAEALVELFVHDVSVRVSDFETLLARVKALPVPQTQGARESLGLVCDSLSVACGLYPTQTLCLKRSYVLVKMLRRRGIPALIAIGVQKLPFKAHAWVMVDGLVVDDLLATRETFTVLETC